MNPEESDFNDFVNLMSHPYTPYSDRLRKQDYTVMDIPIDMAARMIETHHYAKGASRTAVYTHGLFRKSPLTLEGVAWWLPPTKNVGKSVYPQNCQGVLSLSRLVITPNTPKNACTFLLAASRKMIDRNRWPCLVTYADTWKQHDGGIYKADNWTYIGLTKPGKVYTKNGIMVSIKSASNTRSHPEMLALGCEYIGSFAKHKYVHIVDPKKVKPKERTKGLFD